MQLRPSLGHLDTADDANKEAAGKKSNDYNDDMDEDMEPPTLQPLQVQARENETRRERLSGVLPCRLRLRTAVGANLILLNSCFRAGREQA